MFRIHIHTTHEKSNCMEKFYVRAVNQQFTQNREGIFAATMRHFVFDLPCPYGYIFDVGTNNSKLLSL